MFFVQLFLVVTLLGRGNSDKEMIIPTNKETQTSTMRIADTFYTVTSPHSSVNSGYPTTVSLVTEDETSSVEFYSTEFATTKSVSDLAESQKPEGELGTASVSTTTSAAEYPSTPHDKTFPQSPAPSDFPSTNKLASPDVASSAELHRSEFATTKITSDLTEDQAPTGELYTSAASTEHTGTAAIRTISAAEYVSTLDDWTSPQSPAPSDYPATNRLTPEVEASSAELHRTLFATEINTSDVAQGQTSHRELETHAAFADDTSTVAIGTISYADYGSTFYDRTSPQSSAPSNYPTTDGSAPANEGSSVELQSTVFTTAKITSDLSEGQMSSEFYSSASATTKIISNVAEGHTPSRGIETDSVSAAVSSTADIKTTLDVKIARTTYDETFRQSFSESSFLMTEILAQNDTASSEKLDSTQSSYSNQSSHPESQPDVTSAGEADARSTSIGENDINFSETEIKVGEVSSDSTHDYSVVGYSVGAVVLLAAIAPTVFMLVHSQGLISHCAGRLTLSPTQSSPA